MILFAGLALNAQLPEDALRLSNTFPSGTARQQAIGGAMGSLGGDISSLTVNPAGLGFYKSSELVLSPGFGLGSTKSTYLSGTQTGPSTNNFILGTTGFVFARPSAPDRSTAFSLAVGKMADFNAHTLYQGKNSYSSGAEAYALEYSQSNESINQALADPSISYGTRMALYTYLVDTATVSGKSVVISQPEKVLSSGGSIDQRNDIRTTGGITEIDFGFGSNSADKFYFGGSVGVPIVNYRQETRYSETDGTGNTNNDFGSYAYNETYTSKGVGVNAKLGAIYRPSVAWRFGLAIHTPTLYSLNDKVIASMATNTDGYATPSNTTSDVFDKSAGASNRFKYDLNSPWHFLASASYVFGAGATGEATARRQGFITGDAEYVTNKSSRFVIPSDYSSDYTGDGYYDAVNNVVKSIYRNNFRFRAGAEMKFNFIAARIGGSYTTSPYANSDVKYSRATLSGGLGWRNKGFFADLTYVEAFTKDGNFPYRLSDKDNIYAVTKQSRGNVILTVGMRF